MHTYTHLGEGGEQDWLSVGLGKDEMPPPPCTVIFSCLLRVFIFYLPSSEFCLQTQDSAFNQKLSLSPSLPSTLSLQLTFRKPGGQVNKDDGMKLFFVGVIAY